MFQTLLQDLEARLPLPYPERARFLDELSGDLEYSFEALRAQGLDDDLARARVIEELGLGPEALSSLTHIHLPTLQRALSRLSGPVREWLEATAIALPLASCVYYLTMEAPMILFIKEGGVANLLVLGFGSLGLLLLGHRFVLYFLLRDHSLAALRKNTATPLYLSAATLGLGLMGAAMGFYVVLARFSAGAFGTDVLWIGMREPLSCVILSAGLSTLILLFHAAIQVGLRAIRVPLDTSTEAAR